MSSPVGGCLDRNIIQQTSHPKLNRCLRISSIKFNSFQGQSFPEGTDCLRGTQHFCHTRISSSSGLKRQVNRAGKPAREEDGLWQLPQVACSQSQVRSDAKGGEKERKNKEQKKPPDNHHHLGAALGRS